MSAQPSMIPEYQGRAVKLGFLGLGWIGRKRLDAVAAEANVRVMAVSDTDREKLQSAQSGYPDARGMTSFDELLECELDGVVIATPNGAHAEQALACLAKGLPVFCQKPLATNAADTERVIAAAQKANKLLAVDYSYRHVQGMQELRERIRAGELGEINAIDLIFHNAYGPNKQWCFDRSQAGGGCLLDLGVHLIDLALWLQDAPSMRVVSSRLFSQGRVATRQDVEELAYVELVQSNGAVVRIACSWHAQIGCDAEISAHIQGSRGGARWRNVNGSFVDFELDLLRGNQREHLGSSRDDWGPGALCAWIQRLRADSSFDDEALGIAAGAKLIEQAYQS
jgi:predicted dehydrogenase